MIKFDTYQYHYTTDEEGRGPSKQSIHFQSRAICEHAAKGASSWGVDGTVFKSQVLIDDSTTIEEYDKNQRELKRINILNKLTAEEKELLGLV